jgi:polysaccharide export outer membrane protein
MMKNYYLYFFLIIAIVFSSCAYTNSSYFQGVNRNPDLNHKITNYSPLVIQTGDILAMHVKSLSPEGDAIFNSEISYTTTSSAGGQGNVQPSTEGSSSRPTGYRVDSKGEIVLPLVHNIKVAGLTLAEAESLIQKSVTPFLKEPIVTVTLANFRISVLGDVGRNGIFSVDADHISIPEALTLAGDLTISGKRENILLIREVDGERKYVNIDISSSKIFDSPYYYLKNNDILYVEVGQAKYASLNQNSKILPYTLSILSFILVLAEFNHTYRVF